MRLEELFLFVSGYERVGNQIRLYVDGPLPQASVSRPRGVRTPLYHLFSGEDAEAILAWLARNKAWQCLRVPPLYGKALGVRALLVASEWHWGDGSAIHTFSRLRSIRDEAHRDRLRREVRLLIESVIENPSRDGELDDLHLLEDAVNTAPEGVELATPAEVLAAHVG